MIRKATGIGLAAAVALATALVPTQAANAADGCGDGYFKRSDGYLTKNANWSGVGAHNAQVYHTGRVRFCTEDDTFDDDENRRALIGYPSDSYPFESMVEKNGNYAKFCVRQTIRAHMSGIKSSDGWSIGGSFSKGDPQVSFSYSATYDTLNVTVAKTGTCGADRNRIIADTAGITLTADNETGRIQSVQLTTRLDAVYYTNGTKRVANFSLVENDYS